jgi:two-component system NarL family sensor kinase
MVRHHRINKALQQEKTTAEIEVLEEEMKRISLDLHDDIGSVLTTIRMRLQGIVVTDQHSENYYTINILLKEAIQKLKNASFNLDPAILKKRGLLAAVQKYFTSMEGLYPLVLTVVTKETVLPLEKDQEIHVFRIIQETLNNCLKYGNACSYVVHFIKEPNDLRITITDDGNGFDFKNMQKDNVGSGLKNIINRIELLHGEIFIDTKPGKGVAYNILIPIAD